jgi:hypothetical protein
MAGEMSRNGAQRALDAMSGRAAPGTYTSWLALCTTAPTDSTLGTEYAATGYARQSVGAWAVPTAADPPQTQNPSLLTYGPFTAGTGATISYMALMDAVSGGTALANMYAWWTATTAKTPALNDSAQVAAGALTMTCT